MRVNQSVKRNEIHEKKCVTPNCRDMGSTGICAGVLLTGKLLFQSITRLNFDWNQIMDNFELMDACDSWNKEIGKCEIVLLSRDKLLNYPIPNIPLQIIIWKTHLRTDLLRNFQR